jgi:CRP/FNR family cyclic AMP-dependent transcriptional regulator
MLNYYQQLLKNIHFSHDLSAFVLPHLKLSSFEVGDVILEKDCSVHSWQYVISGYVAATVPLDTRKRLPIHIYGLNEWFGEQSILTKLPSHFEYISITPVELISMPKKCFDKALLEDPRFLHFLLGLVAYRAKQSSDMLTLMRQGSSPLQVVMGLAHFVESSKKNINLLNSEGLKWTLDIPIPQNQIADYCGVSRTLFSEYIQHLALAGWLKVRYGGIELQSCETWAIFARKQRERKLVVSRPTMVELLQDMVSANEVIGPYRFPNLMDKRVGSREQA